MFTNFDDDLFDSECSDLIEKLPLQSYNAKVCESEWFNSSENDENCEIFAQKLKFRADLLYHKKEYSKALEEYNKYLEDYAGKSAQMKRDFLECKALCLLKCGDPAEAYKTAKSLELEITNLDHLTVFYLLLVKIQSAYENYNEMSMLLVKLLLMHPLSHNFWFKLGKCLIATCHLDQLNSYKARACFIRSRFILEAGASNLPPSEVTRHEKNLSETEACLKELGPHCDKLSNEVIHGLKEGIYVKDEDAVLSEVSIEMLNHGNIADIIQMFNRKWFKL